VKDVLLPLMLSKAKIKNDRGFYHPITAALLCPLKYPKTPRFVLSIFIQCCFLPKFHLRIIEAIRTGTLAVTAQLLPSILFPDDQVYDSNDISINVLRGHIMIRVFLIHIVLLFYLQLPLGRKTSVSRAVNCSSHDCVCCHTGMSY
jgi:hypothetical protein